MPEAKKEPCQTWEPPPRPEWVQRVNEEGRWMDSRGVVPLDADSLIRSAQQATGLTDFGADDWREHFNVYVKALEEEADLNLMGRLRTRSETLLWLQARLQIEDTYKRHPEIEDEQITKPFIVIGQGRSGTSFLHNVLAADPGNKALLTWETFLPCPPPEAATYYTDLRVERGDQLMQQWLRVTPTLEAIHEYGGSIPMECLVLKAYNFVSPWWFTSQGQVPSYNEYIAKVDVGPTYAYYKRVLKLLQWKNPRDHWALKSMDHLDFLPQLLKVLPDACLIWTHRDPVRAMRSTESLLFMMNWGRSDRWQTEGLSDVTSQPELVAQRLDQPIDWMEKGVVPKARICNVLYNDLVTDTVATMEGIYRHFDIPLTAKGRRGMEEYLKANPREARPPHKYAGESAEGLARARKAFKRYQDCFQVPNE